MQQNQHFEDISRNLPNVVITEGTTILATFNTLLLTLERLVLCKQLGLIYTVVRCGAEGSTIMTSVPTLPEISKTWKSGRFPWTKAGYRGPLCPSQLAPECLPQRISGHTHANSIQRKYHGTPQVHPTRTPHILTRTERASRTHMLLVEWMGTRKSHGKAKAVLHASENSSRNSRSS